MEVKLPKGKYIMAVSGGVDSVVLLDLLSKQNGLLLLVAHFDHGIREDSGEDLVFVASLAETYGYEFISAKGNLGPDTSEAIARDARYAFLREAMKSYGAQAIVTAHHEDDVLETALINLIRGTGRKGLTALESKPGLERPLLQTSKATIRQYAKGHKLLWREDSTNSDTKYLRNYLRNEILPELDATGRKKLLKLVEDQRTVNLQLDTLLNTHLKGKKPLDRSWFVALPHDAAREVMASWLRLNGLADFDAPTIERAVVGAKTARTGKKIELKNKMVIEIKGANLALTRVER